ncbi:hypothetical protein DID75_00400 [Candidatus Marinamargulisbacteria bacterium SCGC AG-410-N11]|nr:hypothetical protein DID75_00400 [Candidatus Marinamargulisbacteria bacterium SCGC AG-410-N11]
MKFKTLMINVICLILVSIIGIHSYAAEFFDHTQVGSSARTIRIGHIEGFGVASNGVFDNPASLYKTKYLSASMFTTRFINDILYYNGSVSVRLPIGTVGFGYMAQEIDDIKKTYKNEFDRIAIQSVFNQRRAVSKFSYQYSYSDLVHLGATYSIFTMKMDSVEGTGQNLDIGLFFDMKQFDVSFALKNLISSKKVEYTDSGPDTIIDNWGREVTYSSAGQKENLELQGICSLSWHYRFIKLYSQIKMSGEERVYSKSFGAEFIPLKFIQVSMGLNETPVFRVLGDEKGELVIDRSITAGVGCDLWGVSLDYAYQKELESKIVHKEYKDKHYFSIGLSF